MSITDWLLRQRDETGIRKSLRMLMLIGIAIYPHLSAATEILGINGQDDRTLNEDDDYPWSAIGRVNSRVGGHCTGTLIAPDLVLTAAHCLWNKRTNALLPASSLVFVAGYKRGDYLASSPVASFAAKGNYQYTETPSLMTAPDDWAVLKLERPISDNVGYVSVEPLTSFVGDDGSRFPLDIVQAGYSQDKPHILTIDKACAIDATRQGGRLAYHNCDAVKGDSGSPLFVLSNGNYSLVGIHVATMGNAAQSTGVGLSIGHGIPMEAVGK